MASDAQLPAAKPDFEHDTVRAEIDRAFQGVSGLIRASVRPLPTQTGDGTYLLNEEHAGLLSDMSRMDFRDWATVGELIKSKLKPGPTDDSDYPMEHIIQLAAKLDPNSKNCQSFTSGFVDVLWNDLQHPPISYLGEDFQYRKADGSYNNIRYPQLGAANTPYARTVTAKTPRDFALPDPGVLFDTLLVRKGDKPHPNKISSVLFYMASIIIHDCFKTDRENHSVSTTSSYLDLAPLYGSDQKEQDEMRTGKDGLIHVDCFSDKRILGFPPGVGVILIMFNRFHNYIATNLAKINEGDRFARPKENATPEQWKKFDNDLFQTARLVTCGLYVNIILKDYVRVILNLQTTNSAWDLDPRTKSSSSIITKTGQGIGNQVSAEFNLLYRWHSCVSPKDAAWAEEQQHKMVEVLSKDLNLPEKDPKDRSPFEIMAILKEWDKKLPKDPQKRCFMDIERGADGRLNDDKLADILRASIEDVAGAFGANRVPQIFKSVEILGIVQGRKWNLATLNEFREYFNLKKHETFEEINSDPTVADALKHLYGHPDKVELYPGIVVEEAKKPMAPGSGLCPGFTISRAILSDAVSLVRGDRFYTVDYTARNLTSWGFKEASYDDNFNHGHVFYKLILRSFPNHFRYNSVYAHYPMTVPSKMKDILEDLGNDNEFNFDPPKFIPDPVQINTWDAGTKILSDKHTFGVTWGDAVTYLMHNDGKAYGTDFMLSGDEAANDRSRQMMQCGLYRSGWVQAVRQFYEKTTIDMVREHAYKLGNNWEVDMVRDVGNMAHVHFSAEVFNLPLKTKKNPLNPLAEQELYGIMALVFICIFFGEMNPAGEMQLRQFARKLTQQLGALVEQRVAPLGSGWNHVTELWEQLTHFHKHNPLPLYGKHMIVELLKSQPQISVKDMVWSHLLGTAGGMVSIQGQLFAQVLDFYLREENAAHWKAIQTLADQESEESEQKIKMYFLEGARICSSVGAPRLVRKNTTVQDGETTHHFKQGDRLLVSFVAASRDPKVFPNPETVDITRSESNYIFYGWGPHQCLGMDVSKIALPTMLRTVARLKGLRRAPGLAGKIKVMKTPEGFSQYLMADGSQIFPFPTTMKLQWDGGLPEAILDDEQ